MQYKTFSELKIIIERELDLETEDFIQPEELKQYFNDGIDIAQAEIHKLGMEDDYFLTKEFISLVNQQSDYELPSNIYANQIKAIEYVKDTTIYTVKRLRGRNRFEDRELINQYPASTDYYRYMIRNDVSTANPVLELIPPSQETSTNSLTIWYHRNANHWEDDDDAACDIPEIGTNFVKQYVRYRCYDKEGHPNTPEAKDRMESAKILMIDTLTNMVPDEDSTMDQDLNSYYELS